MTLHNDSYFGLSLLYREAAESLGREELLLLPSTTTRSLEVQEKAEKTVAEKHRERRKLFQLFPGILCLY